MVERYRPAPKKKWTPVRKFVKGEPRPANSGRTKGVPNKRTALISDSALGAGADSGMPEPIFRYHNEVHKVKVKRGSKTVEINKTVRVKTDEVIGWRQTGKGGLRGYLGWLSLNHPASFTTLLNRILPTQLNVKADIVETVVTKFANIDPSTMTLDQKLAMMQDIISLTKPRQLPAPQANAKQAPQQQEQYEEAEYEEVSGTFREAAE